MANWTSNAYVNSLLLGVKQQSTTLTYYLDDTTGGENAWSTAEVTAMQNAFDAWSSVANISFTRIFTNTADLTEKQEFIADNGALAYHETITDYATATVTTHTTSLTGSYNTNGTGWDVEGLNVGGFGYASLVHEIGHALGLDHTHSDSASDPHVFAGVTSDTDQGDNNLNQDVYSVMSYVTGATSKVTLGTPDADGYGFVGGPMIFDIAAIQYLYGANTTANSGNDTYTLSDDNVAGTYFSSIWDTAGVDEIVYAGSKDATINLNSGSLQNEVGGGGLISQADGVFGGFTIAADFTDALADQNGETGVIIENASGGSGNDTITGNDVSNILLGNAGDDILEGGGGNDELTGGAGADQFVYKNDFDGDIINDFVVGTDKIVIDGVVGVNSFADLTITNDVGETLIQTAGGGNNTLFLTGEFAATLTAADFVINGNAGGGNEPDLVASGLTINASTAQDGDTLSGSVTITNNGTAATGTDFVAGVYLSTDGTVTNGDSLVTQVPVGVLAAGASTVVSYSMPITAGTLTDGTYYVGVVADDNLQIAESNEANNVSNAVSFVLDNSGGGGGLADLVATNFTLDTAIAQDGDVITGSMLVSNNGTDAAGASVAGIYLSVNNTIEGYEVDDDIWVTDVNVGAIAAGASLLVTYSVTVPAGTLSDGTYYVGAVIDDYWVVAESDENNNISNAASFTLDNSGGGGGAIEGTAGNDSLVGTVSNDVINGLAGDDLIEGLAGDDTIDGGLGTDVASYASDTAGISASLITGVVTGALTGTDTLISIEGIDGGEGDDFVVGSAANDIIGGNGGADYLQGRDGDDLINGGAGNDILLGQNDNDTLWGGIGEDQVYGQAGNDILYGDAGDDIVSGGLGNDTVFGGVGLDVVLGGGGDDILNGGDDDDILSGGGGIDTLNGDAGNDTLVGAAGNDTLNGGVGDDILSGGTGNDTVSGGLGNDQVFGAADDDILNGNEGDDTVSGGTGADNVSGGIGNDVVLGGLGNDFLFGNEGIDTLSGGSDDDYLYGGTGNDTVLGGSGIDVLYGDDGDDFLFAGTGNDVLIGGAGNDYMNGQAGDDLFVFADGFGNDTIAGFSGGNGLEQIDLFEVTEIVDFNDLINNHLTQVGNNAVITDGANTITLVGIDEIDLIAADFAF